MNLAFNTSQVPTYKSRSQFIKFLTENWVLNNSYCPSCGEISLNKFENNRPVADFHCKKCDEEYELKSKSGKISGTVVDGAYSVMIERINAKNNPNFFFLTYTKNLTVNDFCIIPKQFFIPEIIIKRPPLAETARRAGWVGCQIDISKIADAGKVFLVKNAQVIDPTVVKETFHKTLFLRTATQESKGWILDVMSCIDSIKKESFTLDDVYQFEYGLKLKHPNNNFIKEKIRQQLQVLRDKEIIEFVSPGNYKKKNYESTYLKSSFKAVAPG